MHPLSWSHDFYHCDSGMTPWVLLLNSLYSSEKRLSELVADLRASNTKPLLRLNVETRGDRELLEAKRDEVAALLGELAG